MIDKTKEYPEMGADLMERRGEIYDQMRYLTNELEKIDHIFGLGIYYMTEQEAKDYIHISEDRDIPKEIICSRLGREKIYLKKDIDEYMLSKKR